MSRTGYKAIKTDKVETANNRKMLVSTAIPMGIDKLTLIGTSLHFSSHLQIAWHNAT